MLVLAGGLWAVESVSEGPSSISSASSSMACSSDFTGVFDLALWLCVAALKNVWSVRDPFLASTGFLLDLFALGFSGVVAGVDRAEDGFE